MSAQLKPVVDENDAGQGFAEERRLSGIFSGLLLLALLAGLVLIIASRLMDPATLSIRYVRVTGNFTNLSPESLENRAADVVRGGFFNVNVDTIKDVLLDDPWVRSVSVRRIWPDRLTVDIREQTAVVRWGDEGLLNPEGEIFYPDHSTFPADIPVVHGPENSYRLVMKTFRLVEELLPEELAIGKLELSDRRAWQLTLRSGASIRLGKTEIRERLERLIALFPVEEVSRPGHIRYIDMRYTNGFAVRWNPENRSDLGNGRENHGKES